MCIPPETSEHLESRNKKHFNPQKLWHTLENGLQKLKYMLSVVNVQQYAK